MRDIVSRMVGSTTLHYMRISSLELSTLLVHALVSAKNLTFTPAVALLDLCLCSSFTVSVESLFGQ